MGVEHTLIPYPRSHFTKSDSVGLWFFQLLSLPIASSRITFVVGSPSAPRVREDGNGVQEIWTQKVKPHWWLVRVVGDYVSGADRQFPRSRLCPLLFVLSRPLIFYILEADSTSFFSEGNCPGGSWLYIVLSLYNSLDNWNRDILIFAYSFTQNAFCNYEHLLFFFAIRSIRLPGRTTWCSAGEPCVAMDTCVWRTWVLPPVPTLFAGQVWLI